MSDAIIDIKTYFVLNLMALHRIFMSSLILSSVSHLKVEITLILKPLKFEYMNEWKSNQEKNMQVKSGSSLKDDNLSNFIRMLNVSIPHKSFDDINSDVLLMVNKERKLISVGLNQHFISLSYRCPI